MALRTGDPAGAEVRFATISLYLAGVWQSVRDGPRRLTQKPAVALAGEIYREFAEAIEGDPARPRRGRGLKRRTSRRWKADPAGPPS